MGTMLYSSKKKAEFLATTMEEKFFCPPGTITYDTAFQVIVDQLKHLPHQHLFFFNPGYIWKTIKILQIPNCHVPFTDNIGDCEHKLYKYKSVMHHCKIFNWCFRLCYLTYPLKHIKENHARKTWKPTQPLSHISIKLAEQTILNDSNSLDSRSIVCQKFTPINMV